MLPPAEEPPEVAPEVVSEVAPEVAPEVVAPESPRSVNVGFAAEV